MPKRSSGAPSTSYQQTLLSAEEHRARAVWLRRFPAAKAQRAAQLHDLAAALIERKQRMVKASPKPIFTKPRGLPLVVSAPSIVPA